VHSRTWLVRCLAELGAFAEGVTCGEEALRIAETLEYPHGLITACQGLGFLYLRKGDLHKAIPLLERGLELCRVANILFWLPLVASMLSSAYTLSGRVAEALPLLRQALAQTASMGVTAYHQWRVVYWLSEAYPLVDRTGEGLEVVRRAVQLSRAHKERGAEAWTLRLLGERHWHQESPEVAPAEDSYREALGLASTLGMRPLQAHCHLGLGTLCAKIGRREEARIELAAAIELYRAMDMTLWLPEAQTALAQVEGR
jgi:tetratricopeptide (TPR) repeat protein